jgi:sugar O-acyltransferase (sialic acid O-acetyltransferase NeuD family)
MTSSILAIVGAGGHARVVADTALEAGWKDVAFFDDRYPEIRETGPWRVSGTVSDLYNRTSEYGGVIVAIGDNDVRLRHHLALAEQRAVMASVVHPRAWVSSRSKIGPGVTLCAGSVVNVGAVVGAACIVNTGATVDHDCELGEAVHVAPGAHLSGNVRVGPRSWIGVGATVRQGIRIGTGVMVGAGAVVVSDLPDGVVAIGCPARPRS